MTLVKKEEGDNKGTTLTKIELREKNLILVDEHGNDRKANAHLHKIGRRVKIVDMTSMPELERKY